MPKNKDLQDKLNQIRQDLDSIIRDLSAIKDLNQAQKLKNSVGDKINQYFKQISQISSEFRGEYGRALNAIKTEYYKKADDIVVELKQAHFKLLDKQFSLDVTESIPNPDVHKLLVDKQFGYEHPLQREIRYMNQLWRSLDFKVFEGRELDLDYFVFEAVNTPKGHPAREMWDTFYTKEGYVPTTQTSNMQVRMMKYFDQLPVKSAMYGKVFRNEDLDATHSHTFYQYEVVYVDKGINIAHLIGVLLTFIKLYYKKEDIEYRIMPAHFPFVEPGIEIHLKRGNSWLEILGAGIIHPEVLKNGGYNPDEVTGFAAGFGIDRMVMLKYGLTDIRQLYQGNISMYL